MGSYSRNTNKVVEEELWICCRFCSVTFSSITAGISKVKEHELDHHFGQTQQKGPEGFTFYKILRLDQLVIKLERIRTPCSSTIDDEEEDAPSPIHHCSYQGEEESNSDKSSTSSSSSLISSPSDSDSEVENEDLSYKTNDRSWSCSTNKKKNTLKLRKTTTANNRQTKLKLNKSQSLSLRHKLLPTSTKSNSINKSSSKAGAGAQVHAGDKRNKTEELMLSMPKSFLATSCHLCKRSFKFPADLWQHIHTCVVVNQQQQQQQVQPPPPSQVQQQAPLLLSVNNNVSNQSNINPPIVNITNNTPSSKEQKQNPTKKNQGQQRPKTPQNSSKKFHKNCPTCGKSFKSSSGYNSHVRSHAPQKSFECSVCSANFVWRPTALSHVKNRHPGVDNATVLDLLAIKCSVCEMVFKNKVGRKLHEKLVHSQQTTTTTAPESMNNDNTGNAPLIEIIADQSQNQVDQSITSTTSSVLSNTSIYTNYCKTCDKSFASTDEYNSHCRDSQHPGQKLFQCSVCSAKFVWRTTADLHVKNRHRGVENANVIGLLAIDLVLAPSGSGSALAPAAPSSPQPHPESEPQPQSRKTYKCDTCVKQYYTREGLGLHKHSKHNPYPRPLLYKCSICFERFQLRGTAHTHVYKTHPGVRSGVIGPRCITCPLCKSILHNATAYKAHMKEIHGKTIKIAAAGAKMNDESASSQKYYGCSGCGAEFVLRAAAQLHVQKHHPELMVANGGGVIGLRSIQCSYCNRMLRNTTEKRIHETLLHPAELQCKAAASEDPPSSSSQAQELLQGEDVELIVPNCDLEFINKTEKELHDKNSESVPEHESQPSKPYSCEPCAQSFYTRDGLHLHNRVQHPPAPRPLLYKCSVCFKRFEDRGPAHAHVYKTHPGVRNGVIGPRCITCQLCHLMVRSKTAYKAHMKEAHGHGHGHGCNNKQQKYHRSRRLLPRLLQQPQQQEQVEESQATASIDEIPTMTITTNTSTTTSTTTEFINNTKSYNCQICHKSFTTADAVNSHARSHAGQKHYSCSVCGAQFVWRSTAHKHVNAQHPGIQNGVIGLHSVKCSYCEVILRNKTEKRIHEELVHSASASSSQQQQQPELCIEDKDDAEEMILPDNHDNEQIIELKSESKPEAFKCSICSELFPTINSYKSHYSLHAEAKPYQCKLCGRSFSRRTHCKTHLKLIHPGVVHVKGDGLIEVLPSIIQCSRCDTMLKNEAEKRIHEHAVHNLPLIRFQPQLKAKPRHQPQEEDVELQLEFIEEDVELYGPNHDPMLPTAKHNKRYKCPICGNSYSKLDSFQSHCRSQHTGEKPLFQCSLCFKSFARRSSAHCHIKLIHPEAHTSNNIKNGVLTNKRRAIGCTMCEVACRNKLEWKQHMKTQHNIDSNNIDQQQTTTGPEQRKTYNCLSCPKSFYNLEGLRNHKRALHTPGPKQLLYKCFICFKRFEFRSSAHAHVYKYHPGTKAGIVGPRCITCHLCKLILRNKTEYKLHMRNRHGRLNLLQRLQLKTIDQIPEEQSSTNTTTTSNKPFNCRICHKSFTTADGCNAHTRAHTGKKAYECSICGAQFVWRSTAHNHVQKRHPGVRNGVIGLHSVKCSYCGMVLRNKAEKSVHEQSDHLQQQAVVVNSGSDSRSSIVMMGVRSAQCSYCDLILKNKSEKQIHEQTEHLNLQSQPQPHLEQQQQYPEQTEVESPPTKCPQPIPEPEPQLTTKHKKYKCTICGKLFPSVSCYNIHYRIHSGETPYQCSLCFKSFARNSNCHQHVKLVHSGEAGDTKHRIINHRRRLSKWSSSTSISCGLCKIRFFNKMDLKNHIKLKHNTTTSGSSTIDNNQKKKSCCIDATAAETEANHTDPLLIIP